MSKDLDKNSAVYDRSLIEKEGYKNYVIEKDQTCLSSYCYKKIKKLENGGEILILVNDQNTLN